MLTIKENTLERIATWKKDSIYILTDFDKTITSGNSITSWGVLEESTHMPQEYKLEKDILAKYYGPIENDETINFNAKKEAMNEWWTKHLNLFIKYQVSEEIIKKESINHHTMTLRKGAKEFLEKLNKDNIPVIIISAGIGNFIESFLKAHNCYYDNIHIISNFITFENGIATGIKSNLIHSQNKNEISMSQEIKNYISTRSNTIILGDNTGDAYMSPDKNALRIGFLEEKLSENKKHYEEKFDIVCINSDFNEILENISILN